MVAGDVTGVVPLTLPERACIMMGAVDRLIPANR
jgi:hypothetical protein